MIVAEEHTVDRDPFKGVQILPSCAQEPNEEQRAALEKIFSMLEKKEEPKGVLLLQGVHFLLLLLHRHLKDCRPLGGRAKRLKF